MLRFTVVLVCVSCVLAFPFPDKLPTENKAELAEPAAPLADADPAEPAVADTDPAAPLADADPQRAEAQDAAPPPAAGPEIHAVAVEVPVVTGPGLVEVPVVVQQEPDVASGPQFTAPQPKEPASSAVEYRPDPTPEYPPQENPQGLGLREAIVDLVAGTEDSGYGPVSGVIHLYQGSIEEPVILTGVIRGLTPGRHGWHVHRDPVQLDADVPNVCTTAGPHFNPFKAPHGAPSDSHRLRHVADLGNIEATEVGIASFRFEDGLISLYPGDRSVFDRTIVIHANRDDLGRGTNEESRRTGNAGARVACGFIHGLR